MLKVLPLPTVMWIGREDGCRQASAQCGAGRSEIGFEPTGKGFGAMETEQRAVRQEQSAGKPLAEFGGLDLDAD